MEQATSSPEGTINRVGTFLLLATYGIFAVGSLQWNNIPIPGDVHLVYKFAVPLVSLILALCMNRSSRFKGYWQVFFAYFVGGAAFLLQLVVFSLLSYPINVETIALEKALSALLTIVPIVALTRLSGGDLGSIYLKLGKLGTGILSPVWRCSPSSRSPRRC